MELCAECGATAANYSPIRHRKDCETDAAKVQRLQPEIERLEKEIIQLKTQILGGSENDSCAIEGMDEAQALKDKQ